MSPSKKFVIGKATRAQLQRRLRLVSRAYVDLYCRYTSGIGLTAEYTLERDMRAGETIQVRVPRPFSVNEL